MISSFFIIFLSAVPLLLINNLTNFLLKWISFPFKTNQVTYVVSLNSIHLKSWIVFLGRHILYITWKPNSLGMPWSFVNYQGKNVLTVLEKLKIMGTLYSVLDTHPREVETREQSVKPTTEST